MELPFDTLLVLLALALALVLALALALDAEVACVVDPVRVVRGLEPDRAGKASGLRIISGSSPDPSAVAAPEEAPAEDVPAVTEAALAQVFVEAARAAQTEPTGPGILVPGVGVAEVWEADVAELGDANEEMVRLVDGMREGGCSEPPDQAETGVPDEIVVEDAEEEPAFVVEVEVEVAADDADMPGKAPAVEPIDDNVAFAVADVDVAAAAAAAAAAVAAIDVALPAPLPEVTKSGAKRSDAASASFVKQSLGSAS